MELSRRIAYWSVTSTPGMLATLFLPRVPALLRRLGDPILGRVLRHRFQMSVKQNERDEVEARRVSELAIRRLDDRAFLVGERVTIADITLASMSAPLAFAPSTVRDHPAVRQLLDWGRTIIDPVKEFAAAGRIASR